MSKIERGELRMDIVQLRLYCEAIRLPLSDLVEQWDAAIADQRRESGGTE